MKAPLTLFFLFFVICATAQDTRNFALFKEGTRLEYKTYIYAPGPTMKTFSKLETTRLIIIVDSVKENDGVLSTYITKKGIAANNPNCKYTKNFIIKSDGKRIILPFVLYLPDTIYGYDVQALQSVKRSRTFSAFDYPQNGLAFLVPSSFNGVHDMEFDKRKTKAKGTMMGFTGDLEFTIRRMYVEGQEKVTTKAGEFDCYKILWEGACVYSEKHAILRELFYYNEQTGLIKAEYEGSYIELVDVR